jgi:hypothetical protein
MEQQRPDLSHYIGLKKNAIDVKNENPSLRWVRVIKPGSCHTMEYCPERVNLHVDEEGKITKITFG